MTTDRIHWTVATMLVTAVIVAGIAAPVTAGRMVVDGDQATAGAGNDAVTGPIPDARRASHTDEVQLREGDTFFVGQRLTTEAYDAGDEVTLRRADGTFSANFSGLPPGSYTLWSNVSDTTASDSVSVDVVRAASITVSDQLSGTGGAVTVDSVFLPDGGFVSIYDGSTNVSIDGDTPLGSSDYLGPGTHSDVTVRLDEPVGNGNTRLLAVAHRDTNSDQIYNFVSSGGQSDGPYHHSGEPVTDAFTVSVPTATTTPRLTPTSTDTKSQDASTTTKTPPSNEIAVERMCDHDVGPLVEAYDANVDEVPALLNGLVSDRTIHLIVTDDSDLTRDYTVVTSADKRISAVRAGVPDGATLEVETDCETVTTVGDADDTVDAFADEYEAGEITVRGVGLGETLIVAVVKLLVGLGQWLGV